jgi:hypothetical protein
MGDFLLELNRSLTHKFCRISPSETSFIIKIKSNIFIIELVSNEEDLDLDMIRLHKNFTFVNRAYLTLVVFGNPIAEYFFIRNGIQSDIVEDNLTGIITRIQKWINMKK